MKIKTPTKATYRQIAESSDRTLQPSPRPVPVPIPVPDPVPVSSPSSERQLMWSLCLPVCLPARPAPYVPSPAAVQPQIHYVSFFFFFFVFLSFYCPSFAYYEQSSSISCLRLQINSNLANYVLPWVVGKGEAGAQDHLCSHKN